MNKSIHRNLHVLPTAALAKCATNRCRETQTIIIITDLSLFDVVASWCHHSYNDNLADRHAGVTFSPDASLNIQNHSLICLALPGKIQPLGSFNLSLKDICRGRQYVVRCLCVTNISPLPSIACFWSSNLYPVYQVFKLGKDRQN